MICTPQNMTGFVTELPQIVPSKKVCKQLFDFSDPLDKKELNLEKQEMLKSESLRLKLSWGFDSTAVNFAEKETHRCGDKANLAPVSVDTSRYDWKLQDPKSVPYFYIRPFRQHHSEARNLDRALIQKESVWRCLSRNHGQTTSLMNGCPMKCVSAKDVPFCANPPEITSTNFNRALVRTVTAVRVPVPGNPQTNLSSEDNALEQVADPKLKYSVNATQISTTVKDSETTVKLKRPSAKCLLSPKEGIKRRKEDLSCRQRQITEMIPQRKSRLSMKRSNPSPTVVARPIIAQLSD